MFADFAVPFAGPWMEPLGEEGPVDGLDGVTDGVTLRGRAADDGGGILQSASGAQYSGERSSVSCTLDQQHTSVSVLTDLNTY